jgi:DNA-binding MarR family transcriptional regulator
MMDNANLSARLQQAIYEIIRNANVIDETYMEPHGVTVAQGYTLLAFPAESAISMSELSERMRLAKSTMTRMADQLTAKGLVDRAVDLQDRRMVQVELTAAGRALRRQMDDDFRQFFDRALEAIPAELRAAAVNSLELIVNALANVMEGKHGKDYDK